MLGREFGLTPQQTQAAVMALLPAISTGLKQATATPEGLGELFSVMGQQRDLQAMYGAPDVAFAPQGRAAGNDVLSVIFGSPDVSRAVVDQAQRFSGVTGAILKKMLPVIAGIIISGLMGGARAECAEGFARVADGRRARRHSGPDFRTQHAGRRRNAAELRRRNFPRLPRRADDADADRSERRATICSARSCASSRRACARAGSSRSSSMAGRSHCRAGRAARFQFPMPGGQREPAPMPMPERPGSSPQPGPQMPGGDILGQILRDLLGGGGGPGRAPQQRGPSQRGPSPEMKDLSDLSKQLGVMGGVGSAVFGDRFEVGRDVDQEHLESIQSVFDRFFGTQRR